MVSLLIQLHKYFTFALCLKGRRNTILIMDTKGVRKKAAHQSDKCFVVRLVTAAIIGAANCRQNITQQNLELSTESGNNF